MEICNCPVCGNPAEKHGSWKMPDGSRNRLYVHETKPTHFGFQEVTKSCIANEPPNKACSRRVPRRGAKVVKSKSKVRVGRTRG